MALGLSDESSYRVAMEVIPGVLLVKQRDRTERSGSQRTCVAIQQCRIFITMRNAVLMDRRISTHLAAIMLHRSLRRFFSCVCFLSLNRVGGTIAETHFFACLVLRGCNL
jgi:hypothetical protein